jgi:F0F1-type ATP synthase membrane subunit b/b'
MDLPLGINIVNIGIYMVLFGVLYFALARFLFPMLGKAIKERELKIKETFDNAEKAEKTLKDHEKMLLLADMEVVEIITEGKRQAKVEYDKIIVKARDDAREIVANAHAQVKKVEQNAIDEQNLLVIQKVKTALSQILSDERAKIDDEVIKKIVKQS